MNNANNFISCGDLAVGGSIPHKDLIRIVKRIIKDKDVSTYLKGAYSTKKLLSQSTNSMVE